MDFINEQIFNICLTYASSKTTQETEPKDFLENFTKMHNTLTIKETSTDGNFKLPEKDVTDVRI